MKFLRWTARGLGALAVVLIGVGLVARLSDGPIGPFAGGALSAGELVPDSKINWSFARDLDTIEFQLLNPPRSRTVWIVVRRGEMYIPCEFAEFTLWKQWPQEALEDGRAMVRILGKRYPVQAVRVTDPKVLKQVDARLRRKYKGGTTAEPGDAWIFRMDPRTGRTKAVEADEFA